MKFNVVLSKTATFEAPENSTPEELETIIRKLDLEDWDSKSHAHVWTAKDPEAALFEVDWM